jgi:N-acetylmuramoyl-L-alanine amidase
MGTAAAAPSEPSEIKDIESRRIDAHTTEVTISASGPITCQSALFDRPARLVLDVPNASLKLLSPDLNVDSPGVKQIRTGSFPQGSSNSHPRIVLDLTSRSSFQVLSERDRSLIRVLVREMTPGPNGMMTGSPVAGHTICIDPGHCDQFCGARGLYGLKEEEVTLDVAKRLEQLLTAAGANAVMTRTTGAAPSGGGSGLTSDLIERAEIANRAHAEVFLSIHCDANPGHHTIGSLTIYGHDRSIQWASIVYRSLTGTLGHGGTGLHYRPLVKVTEYTNMPSTLAELGFLDTEADAVKLIDLDFRQKEAEGLFHAFETYFGGREQSPPDLPENMPGGAVHPIPSAPGDQAQDHTTADSGDNDDTERSSGE